MDLEELKRSIRTIPDYPKPGILFRDITTLLGDARAFRYTVDELVRPWTATQVDRVAGIEARGFILGGAVAHQLSVGFVPVRKKGKLPWKVIGVDYDLEYGVDIIEMHEDAIDKGERVLLVDDLIATGGTAAALGEIVGRLGGEVFAYSFLVELTYLAGRARLDAPTHTLIDF